MRFGCVIGVALAPLVAACGGPPPAGKTTTTTPADDATLAPGFRDLVGAPRAMSDEIDRKRAASEILFVDEQGHLVSTAECAGSARWTWKPERDARVVQLASADDTRGLLVGSEIAEQIVAGRALRASVAVSGRFVADEQPSAPKGCSATRYAASITVGAYAMAWINPRVGSTSGLGSSGSHEEKAMPELSRGVLAKCSLDPAGPPADCATPVAIVAKPLRP